MSRLVIRAELWDNEGDIVDETVLVSAPLDEDQSLSLDELVGLIPVSKHMKRGKHK